MNINGGSGANNYTPTSSSYSTSTSYSSAIVSFTGSYFSTAAVPLSIRPLSGITYPRYS